MSNPFLSSACPLVYASFLGDKKTLESLLLTGAWSADSLDDALMAASAYNHTASVKCLLKDGRCDLGAKQGEAMGVAALQNHVKIVSLLLEHGAPPELLRPYLAWVAHMDHHLVLKSVAKHGGDLVFCDHVLVSALRSNSYKCVDYLLMEKEWQIGPEPLRAALEQEPNRKYIRRMLNTGARTDSALFDYSLQFRDPEAGEIRKQRIKQLWRRAKCVLLVNCFWRHFILDYYSPGNQFQKKGKGFTDAFERFKKNL